MELISINDAAAKGISRLRSPKWVTAEDHLKIDIFDGRPGPWLHLYAPFNRECNGRDPVDTLFTMYDLNAEAWLPYNGPLPDSEEYKSAQGRFDGCLSSNTTISDPCKK